MLTACLAAGAATPAAADDWLRFGGDAQVTNDVLSAQAPDFQPSNASKLQVRWTSKLDGAVLASPLYAQGVTITGRTADVVYAATQGGSVYALDATDGTVLWQRELGTAESTCINRAGDKVSYGIVSTGVIDRVRNMLYVIGAPGFLYALDLSTGETAAGWPVQVTKDPTGEFVWGGLTLVGNRVYVPVASYCDDAGADGVYADGRLDAVDVDYGVIVASFDVVQGVGDLGSIWGWGGASVDPKTGDLWVATGNSWVFDNSGNLVQTAGYAESVVQLDANLNVLASDRPVDLPGEVEDADFGSTPLLFQPPGCPPYAAAYAKNGELYVWQRDGLSGGPVWSFHAGPSDISNAFVGEPSYSPELNMLVVADARTYDDEGTIVDFDAVTAFKIGPGCSFPTAPTWVAPGLGRGAKAPAILVGGLAFVVAGFAPGVFALDAATGAIAWSQAFGGSTLAPPSFGGGQVYAGDSSGVVSAIGVGPTLPPPPPAPPPPPPAALVAGKVVHTRAVAGRSFTASMPVRYAGERVVGTIRCPAKVGGRTVPHARSRAAGGAAICTWGLPLGARGKRLSGSIAESYHGSRVSRSFSTLVYGR